MATNGNLLLKPIAIHRVATHRWEGMATSEVFGRNPGVQETWVWAPGEEASSMTVEWQKQLWLVKVPRKHESLLRFLCLQMLSGRGPDGLGILEGEHQQQTWCGFSMQEAMETEMMPAVKSSSQERYAGQRDWWNRCFSPDAMTHLYLHVLHPWCNKLLIENIWGKNQSILNMYTVSFLSLFPK